MSQIKNGRILSSEESQSEHELKENDDTAYDSDGNQVPSLDRSLSKKEKQKLKMIVSRAKREQRVPLPVKKQPVKGMSQFLSQFGIERGQTHPPQFSQSVNQSLAQSSQSGNQPAEEVVAEGVTQLADMSVTQSVTQPVDDLVAQSLNASVDQTTTQSVNQLADMSVMQPADVPVTQTVDDTMAEAVDEPKLQTEEQLKTAEHKQTTVSQEMSHLKIKQLPTNLVPVKHMSSDSELEIEIVQINPRTPQEKKPKISKVEMNRQMLFLAEEQSRRRRQEEEEERKMQQEERKKKRAEKRMEFETFLEENRKKAMEPEPEPEPDILDIVDAEEPEEPERVVRKIFEDQEVEVEEEMDYQDSDGNLLELPEASEESSMDQGSQSESEAPLESEQEDIHPESTRDETDSPEKTTLIPTDALETQTESTGLSLIESTQQKQSNDLMAGSLFSESQIMPLLSGNFSASLYSGSLPSAKPDPQSESLLQGSLKDSFKSSERMSLGEDIGDYLSGAFSSNTNEQSTDRPSAHRESQRQSQFTLSETVEHSLVRESVDHSLVRDTEERKVEKSKFIEYEAEIEEDEFMHLGGVDGEDFMGIDEYEKDMLQDGKVKLNAKAVLELHQQQLLETDQQAIKSILEDVTSGAYRKRRRRIDPDGKGLDLYDSDEENEALLRQIRKRMGLSIRKKKEIEDPIERLAADPKTAAFANCFSRAEKESMLSEGSEDELQKPMLKPDSDHESQSTEQSFSQGSDILSRILERRTKMKPSAPAQKTNPILFQHANRLLSKKSLLTVVESQESNADKITKSSMVFKSLVQTETKTVVQRKPKTDHKLRKIISKRTE